MHDAIVIGAGQSGLAVSYYLRKYGADFVVLDASDTSGGAWPHYWDALTLFSRAEFSNLPGWPMPHYDGYPPRDHVVEYLSAYEKRYDLPIRRGERVKQVLHDGSAFHLNGYSARNVVMATGIWSAPFVPFIPGSFAGEQVHSAQYRRPKDFAGQRVAVVGGGNSGAQIVADLGLAGVDVQWFTRRPPAFMPEEVDGEQLFRRNREHFVAISRGEDDPGGADFGGDIVLVPEVPPRPIIGPAGRRAHGRVVGRAVGFRRADLGHRLPPRTVARPRSGARPGHARPVRPGLRLIERPRRRHHRRREPLRPRHRLAHRGQGLAHNRGSSYQDLDNRCFTSNSWALVAGNSPPTQTSRLEFGGCRPIVGPRLIVRNVELRIRARSAPTTPTSKPPSAPCSSNRLPATNSWPTPVVRNAELRSPQARAKHRTDAVPARPIAADPAIRTSIIAVLRRIAGPL